MVKLGVIGCGGIATHQLTSVWDDGLFDLVAGTDIRPEQLELFAEKFGMGKGYADHRDMLAEADLDAVMVCTPTYLHAEHTIAAAEAGKAVFCQKPMAMNTYDCYKVIQTCEACDVKLQLGFVRRYDTDWGTLKRVVESGELGRPLVWRQIAGGPGPKRPFFMNKMEGGGPMIDGMVHNYDFACHCFGAPVEVKSMPVEIHHSTTALDTGTVCVRFEDGDTIMVAWSWGLPEGVRTPGHTDVLGPNGALYFPGSFDASKFQDQYDPKTEGAYLMVLEGGEEKLVTFKRQNMFREELRHFAEWVTEDGAPRVGGDAGLASTRIAELALGGGGLI
ncbi:MAG: Gfo/Idh/MocA family oxidoreductase [Lentisphaerae bacterium]|jgi:predicted dehydrogenase|nr:Gfo/Idh/MocA family oxidoreductase [Lentisphaerota bacterium]MBT4814395.1 Gfo/Idh/MocA family oxidoreductase [Lentisphaerota bacterium]MBT5608513.1 Gfo/Idh/MocA family oxidoreductase [Lentisphaerota bacterium]MBT7058521.1 Gfo/Idh/MocA family oxidoreductase [Lentisphaerota bacterium]MBT7843230.1 Gfo/Idh/MocA family oxidoreductase [Lentisphaerota bacterium]